MIDRDIATRARELVERQTQPDSDAHENETAYRSLCEGFPALLRTAGLARTVTFLHAKRSAEHAALLEHLTDQLRSTGIYSDVANRDLNLLKYVIGAETAAYRHASSLAFRAAHWHKRMAQALLRQKERKVTAPVKEGRS